MSERVVDLDHPANAAVLRRFRRGGGDAAADLAPEEVADHWGLGTHPDLLNDFWDNLTEGIPDAERCRRVVYGRPALVSPVSGVIFGFAGGTHTVAFRLPPGEREMALRPGARASCTTAGTPTWACPRPRTTSPSWVTSGCSATRRATRSAGARPPARSRTCDGPSPPPTSPLVPRGSRRPLPQPRGRGV